ncbi:hypothetical protein Dimus_016212, partial [Dionaea muscipula]
SFRSRIQPSSPLASPSRPEIILPPSSPVRVRHSDGRRSRRLADQLAATEARISCNYR